MPDIQPTPTDEEAGGHRRRGRGAVAQAGRRSHREAAADVAAQVALQRAVVEPARRPIPAASARGDRRAAPAEHVAVPIELTTVADDAAVVHADGVAHRFDGLTPDTRPHPRRGGQP